MKRKRFFLLLTTSCLLGCTNMTLAASAGSWIVDDGTMELTPEYTVQHVQGQPYSDVYAAFTFNPQKKLVRLRERDTITVNGYALTGTPSAQGFFYRARLPIVEGAFTFVLTRSTNQRMTHSFELPILGIRETPAVYRTYETLRVPVHYIEPPAYVSDTYSLPINDGVLRFTLDSKRWKKDNRYQFDRLPDIEGGAIIFRHITERAPPPGTYPAEIQRQHRIVLSDMSDVSRTGWATLTNTMPFMIQVK